METIGFKSVPVNTTPLDQAIEAANSLPGVESGIGLIAQACGTSRQFINKMRRQWRAAGEPPRALREHAASIEFALGGRIKADDLYPDVIWSRDASGRITHYIVPVKTRTSHAQ